MGDQVVVNLLKNGKLDLIVDAEVPDHSEGLEVHLVPDLAVSESSETGLHHNAFDGKSLKYIDLEKTAKNYQLIWLSFELPSESELEGSVADFPQNSFCSVSLKERLSYEHKVVNSAKRPANGEGVADRAVFEDFWRDEGQIL